MAKDELERRFLVDPTKLNSGMLEGRYNYHITQGYLNPGNGIVTRVRKMEVNGTTLGYLTLKSRLPEGGHREFEYEIPAADAKELLGLCGDNVLTKTRYLVQEELETVLVPSPLWEIDVFEGKYQGLIVAEIELPSFDQEIELLDCLGPEITGMSLLGNYTMATDKATFDKALDIICDVEL